MMLASTTAAAVKSVQVVTVPPDAAGVTDGGLLPPAGSVVIYVGDVSAPEWQRLRAAALDGDWKAVRDTAIPQHPTPGAELVAASIPFDLVCAGHVMVRDLALPHGVPFRTLTFPYTGGPIRDTDFGIVEHTDRGAPAVRATYLMMRRAPQLTRLERQLLDGMDPEERHVHMGRPEPCQTLTAMDALTDGIGRAAQDAVREKHARGGYARDEGATMLSESEITEIAGESGGPAASVADLLATRRRHFSY
ncbi:hypothetical protein [Streptomyces sp. WM6378]|uniref:hypothetical protein n=1 Tax=Streptomyces sp. WM6378 TaxID=1415557 RepID=UPI0006AEAC2C|nr:hypothetical protein [Streptomyces sp. WM6378]KOU54382.1 hypothetical protein ADK54_01730 [Streptomyces sp. WM6378]